MICDVIYSLVVLTEKFGVFQQTVVRGLLYPLSLQVNAAHRCLLLEYLFRWIMVCALLYI